MVTFNGYLLGLLDLVDTFEDRQTVADARDSYQLQIVV